MNETSPSKIIPLNPNPTPTPTPTPTTADATAPSAEETAATPEQVVARQARLTPEEANSLGAALRRFIEIGDSKILTREIAAEKRGLEQYLTVMFLTHGAEFLGCWFTVRLEYEPLVQSVARLTNRVRGLFMAPAAVPDKPAAE